MTHVDLRVIYGDTDQMGVVYYANYLRFFEASRGAFVRACGLVYGDVEKSGYVFPVTEAHVRYLKPARFDDVIRVEVALVELKRASMRFSYRVTRGEALLADGFTVHACLDARGRPVRFPDDVHQKLAHWKAPPAGV